MTQDAILKKSRKHLNLVCLVATVLLSSCLENMDNVVASAPAPTSTPGRLAAEVASTSEHLGLTPAYLEGDWCHTHTQFPNSRSLEQRNHRFATDGTFTAQIGPALEMKPGLVYAYRPKGRIGMDHLLYQVKSVQTDDFVLHIAVNDLHFHRGLCK